MQGSQNRSKYYGSNFIKNKLLIIPYQNVIKNLISPSRVLLILLFRRAPWALEGGPSERLDLLGVGREDSEWGRRTTKGVLPEAIEVGASLQLVLECLRLLLAQRARRVGCRIQ